ncbi:hypothetical protein GCM10017673_28220 [Streptosporangium violaceochromogenes]|nr:hypothetical protein GCM10017673_28220 [Streptosporangium violaceochromogenes]
MFSTRLAHVRIAAALLLAVSLTSAACGREEEAPSAYPSKDIEVVVPFSAGGFTDSGARLVVDGLKKRFGRPVTIANKEGAGGVTATTEFLTAKPDGYTIEALISGPTTEALAANPALPYKWDSFTVLGGIAISPRVIVAPAQGRIQSAQDLLKSLKETPSAVTWSTGSPQGPATFSTLALFDALGVDAAVPKRVTFNGDGPAANAVAGGHVDFSAVNVSTALPLIKAGKIRPLIVSGTEEFPLLPGTPVAAQVGLEDFILDNWLGFMAPPKTPGHIVQAWESALAEIAKDRDLAAKLENIGMVMRHIPAGELTGMVKRRFDTSSALVAKFGLK